jgi:S-DNA-T family DNA segregation ATPase FtsK/SpoIIIE
MKDKLSNFLKKKNVDAQVLSYKKGVMAHYLDLHLGSGSNFSNITKLSTEIALALKLKSIPRIYPILSEGVVRIECIAKDRKTIKFKNAYKPTRPLDLVLGHELGDDKPLTLSLSSCPHIIVSGATQSGKSVILHNMVRSCLYFSDKIDLILCDPKHVEFHVYKNYVQKVSHNTEEIVSILHRLYEEMEKRFTMFQSKSVRNIDEFNSVVSDSIKYKVIIIDELADLMPHKSFEDALLKLSQKSRAAGIYIIVATQRPSTDIISGSLKANFPARITCRLPSHVDSKVILDSAGAEVLLGKGDALVIGGNYPSLVRFQSFYQDYSDVEKFLNNFKTSSIKDEYSFWNYIDSLYFHVCDFLQFSKEHRYLYEENMDNINKSKKRDIIGPYVGMVVNTYYDKMLKESNADDMALYFQHVLLEKIGIIEPTSVKSDVGTYYIINKDRFDAYNQERMDKVLNALISQKGKICLSKENLVCMIEQNL